MPGCRPSHLRIQTVRSRAGRICINTTCTLGNTTEIPSSPLAAFSIGGDRAARKPPKVWFGERVSCGVFLFVARGRVEMAVLPTEIHLHLPSDCLHQGCVFGLYLTPHGMSISPGTCWDLPTFGGSSQLQWLSHCLSTLHNYPAGD